MTSADKKSHRKRAIDALINVCSHLPHLSELAGEVDIRIDRRVNSAAVTASGLVLVNPDWFGELSETDATFVMAHELLHLALQHHTRDFGLEKGEANVIQDYIINDMLVEDLGQLPPAGGLYEPGARHSSFEELAVDYRKNKAPRDINSVSNAFEDACPETHAGVLVQDVLDEDAERELFPDAADTLERKKRIREVVEQVSSLETTLRDLARRLRDDSILTEPWWHWEDTEVATSNYVPPWEIALQMNLESAFETRRSFSCASRRPLEHDPDLVRPGRHRLPLPWLNIVIDTSPSLEREIPRMLGVISSFCLTHGVEKVRVVQCRWGYRGVSSDTVHDPEDLENVEIVRETNDYSMRCADLSPGLELLARDPEVTAVVVVGDNIITYPENPVPYTLIWAILEEYTSNFNPPYGTVISVPIDLV